MPIIRLPLEAALLAALALMFCPAPAAAQLAEKRPLTPADFAQWRDIEGEALSDDGRWVIYSLVPQVGEGEVVVRALPEGPEYRHTRGYIGRPQAQAGASRGSAYDASPARLTKDGRFAVFTIDPPREAIEQARAQKKKGKDAPKSSLGVMTLANGSVSVTPGVKGFRLPDDSGQWLAYLLADGDSADAEPADSAAAPAMAAAAPGEQPRPVASDTAGSADEKKKDTGSTLVLLDLANSAAEVRIRDVMAYAFDDAGQWLAYTVSSSDGSGDGAFVRSLSDGSTHALLAGEGHYQGLIFDEGGTQLAFVSDRDSYAADTTRFALYHASLRDPAAKEVVASGDLAAGRVIADKAPLRFTEDGRMIRFGVAAAPLDSIPADSLAERAVFDLWHYQDARLQPQQRIEADDDQSRAYPAVYNIRSEHHTVLGSDSLSDFEFSEHGNVAIAFDESPYAVQAMWGEWGRDVYVVDAATGTRTLAIENAPFGASLSPGGRYVLWFARDGQWHAYGVRAKRDRELTSGLDSVSFAQEIWDTPSTPAPWGVAGWTEGDETVLLYDRYDVWEMDPAGRRPPRVLTDSAGARGNMVLRLVDLDDDEEWIDPADPVLLRALDQETKQSGFWTDRIGANQPPQRMVMAEARFGSPGRAEDAPVYLFTRSTFSEFPDLWVSGPGFDDPRKISEANPQQADYRWGDVELVEWLSSDGVPLKGLLYKPEDFDPSKKYPLVAYFYEQLSDNLYQYRMDTPRNLVHPTLYASNGYLVFMPDIYYTEGYPGPSALKSIVPGVQSLVARGFVDPEALGIQGQSWGGYQTAYIITQTPIFAAAMAGAPVANMTSAYGGIRWGSGVARTFQYEKTQSRIGGSLWEYPWRYIENSPLFAADRVSTPLLMMHNDGDGAVPWYQGIEMFLALRRLGQETYLINYNDDAHNPTKRANQLDIATRMLQFFDHHLKGEPAPEWMREGIPFLQKGRAPVQIAAPQPVEPGEQPNGEPQKPNRTPDQVP